MKQTVAKAAVNVAVIIVACALLPAISYAAQAAGKSTARKSSLPAANASGGRIYVVNGDVTVAQGRNPAHRVINNEAVVSDTMVNTGDKSSALLKFDDGQIVTMQANSTFHVFEYRYDAKRAERSNIVFSMFKGGMRFVTGLIGQRREKSFRLLTPNATIGIRGTEFMVTMMDNSMYSQVLAGNIALTNAAGTVALGAGQSAVVTSSGALASVVAASAIPSGTFSELLSIPVNPSAISAPAPTPAPVPASVPAPVSAPAASDAAAGMAGAAAGAGIATAGASPGVSALAGMAGSDSDSKPVAAQAVSPDDSLNKPAEPVKAEEQKEADASSRSGMGLTARIGTLGYGVDLAFGSSDSFSTRVGLNAYTYKHNGTSSTVDYDFKLQLQTASVLADWYPFSGSLRASGGLLYNNNKASLNGKPTSGTYTINGVSYVASDVGSLQGTMKFNKVAPYLGIGWGNPVAKDKGWGMVSDFGVMFQGKPKTSLTATCGAAIVATVACTQLQSDTSAENAKLQNDLSHFRWWPVISFGISYQW